MSQNALLKTKLRPSLVGRDIVARPRLLDRLGCHRPLTLIVAPAGYGKTTLVVDWLEHADCPYAWVTLDAHDDSLTAFATYVLAAIQGLFPDACPETRALLNGASPLLPAAVAHTLVNELEALSRRFVLVLDDYHAVQDVAIHELVAELLRHQPNTLELVLVARHDPPLPLPEWRAHNRVTEIRIRELRFSLEESRSLLRQMDGLSLDESQVMLLDTMTEGWPAGLRMVALLIQQEGGMAATGAYLDQSGRFALEYLANETFSRLAPDLQEFLLKTAFLEQVCAPLGAALVGGAATAAQCQAYLDSLTSRNLFVFALDEEGMWHHYHYLLRTVLQERAGLTMAAGEIAALHLQASEWLEAHDHLDGAIGHAVKAGDVQAVAELVRRHRHELLNGEHWARLETWRRLIPRAMIDQHPQLLILDAWSLSHRALIADLGWCLDAVEARLAVVPLPADEERLLRSEIDAMRSQAIFWTGNIERALELGQRALAAAPLTYAYARAHAWLFQIVSLTLTGDARAASARVDEALAKDSPILGVVYTTRVFAAAGYLYWIVADMLRLDDCANRLLVLAQERGLREYVCWGRYFRASARYQRNDLAGAEEDFAAVMETPYCAPPAVYVQGVIGLASTRAARGEFDGAETAIVAGLAHCQQYDNPLLRERIEGYQAFMRLRQGKVDEALRWVTRPCLALPGSPMPFFHATLVARVAILLGQGSAEARTEADELSALLRANVEGQHNPRFQIEVLALQAFALASSGEEEAALDLLERAVLLTVPGEVIRALADLDWLLGPLLEKLGRRSKVRTQIARIRRAALVFVPGVPAGLGAPTGGDGAWRPGAPFGHPAHARDADVLEALTNREMDVLALLVERLSNKEIAQQLAISVETVKSHLTNVFEKLDVENRRQAVIKARALGVLPPK